MSTPDPRHGPRDPATRRSRLGWPLSTTDATTTPAGTHSHPLPKVMRRSLFALMGAVVLLAAAVAVLAIYVVQDHNYVLGRGVQRDRENAALRENIRTSICDLLDQLPEGGLLDRPREKYGCGPGLPLSSFPPEVQDQIRGQSATPGTPTDDDPAELAGPEKSTGPADAGAAVPGGANGPMAPAAPPPAHP